MSELEGVNEPQKAAEKERELRKVRLLDELKSHNIPVDKWGTGNAKTFGHLFKEIESGETQLTIDEKGELLRQVSVIYLNGSVAEKMQSGENPVEAVKRALLEELGVSGDTTIREGKVEEVIQESPSYPGLQSKFTNYKFEVILNKDQYKGGGYVEEQPDKRTFFIWMKQEVPESLTSLR